LGADSGASVSSRKIPLPGNRDRHEQRPVRHRILLRDEPKHLVLARPFGWQIAKADDAHSVRQPTFNSGFDEMWCKEGERDHHIDLSYAAAFSRRNCLCICRRIPVADKELFFDIEVDPMRDICYLHGFLERTGGDNGTERFVAFFADEETPESEEKAFQDACLTCADFGSSPSCTRA
jgi:hypothetical protein